jgi:peptidyl-prolyl cis-trans isomerase SurA
MTTSRSLNIPAILILGTILTTAPALAQTGSDAIGMATAPAPANDRVVEDIVARVNDQIITQSDFDRAKEQMQAEASQQGAPPQAIQDQDKNLLRDLIDQQLMLSKGKDLGITGEAELVHRLDDIRKQNHLDTMEDLEKAAQSQGVSYEDFKASIRNGIITQQVIQQEVSRHVPITQQDVQAYFKAHQSEFAQPESVHLREILIATPAGSAADSAEVTAADQKAEALEGQLKAGASFEQLAKDSSSGPAAANGGDLGEFRRGMLAKQLEDQTFNLNAGQFTEPIRTKQGYVILEVSQHTPGGEANFKDVQQQVEEAIFTERLQPALREYLTKLREAASIDIKPGFVDSGASPDEIHPSYSAYVPPGPKEKKQFKRTRFRGKVRSNANASKTQASKAAPGTGTTASAAAQTKPAAPVTTASNQNTQTPGKKEKVRFGQAPRESLPATQTADATSADAPDANSGSPIGAEEKQEKTRFSQRPAVHKAKKPQDSDDKANAPSADEQAAQKVQDAPLGLADQAAKAKKKEKEKGDKTRYADKPKQPAAPPQQPYMGGQTPVPVGGNPPAQAAQPATGGQQPQPQTPNGTQP